MFNQMERELKCLVTKNQYEIIVKSYDFSNPWIQENYYYDTPSNQVKSQGAAMRIRIIGDKKIFTLKTKKDEVTHYEYEEEIDTDSITDIKDEEVLEWISKLNLTEPLVQTLSTKTKRQICRLENAELCADENWFGDVIDYEIEYEYTKDHDGIPIFNEILSKIGIKYKKNCPSKIARANDYILCNKR